MTNDTSYPTIIEEVLESNEKYPFGLISNANSANAYLLDKRFTMDEGYIHAKLYDILTDNLPKTDISFIDFVKEQYGINIHRLHGVPTDKICFVGHRYNIDDFPRVTIKGMRVIFNNYDSSPTTITEEN